MRRRKVVQHVDSGRGKGVLASRLRAASTTRDRELIKSPTGERVQGLYNSKYSPRARGKTSGGEGEEPERCARLSPTKKKCTMCSGRGEGGLGDSVRGD